MRLKFALAMVLALCLGSGELDAQKVTTLQPAAAPLSGTELLYCVQAGVSKKCTAGELASLGAAAGGMAQAGNNASLKTLPSSLPSVVRTGFATPGDAPSIVYVPANPRAPCSLNGGAGDGGSQVPSGDGGCFLSSTTDPLQYGAAKGVYGFYTVTTTAGNGSVTIVQQPGGAPAPTSANANNYITILGAGPTEQRLIAKITGVSGNAVTVSPAPTQSMSGFSTQVYYGPDAAPAINAAMATGSRLNLPVQLPSGVYMVAEPLLCSVVNYNNTNEAPPTCVGLTGSGAQIMAVTNMSGSTPDAGTVLTIGGFPAASPFSQIIRNATYNGNGLMIDGNMIASHCYALPFFVSSSITYYNTKNCNTSDFHFGSPSSPLPSGGMNADYLTTYRDIFEIPVTNITCASNGQYNIQTAIDHGVASGRIVSIRNANNIPGSLTGQGTIIFQWTSTGTNTGIIHGISCTPASFPPYTGCGAPPGYAGCALLSLTPPNTAIIHKVTASTNANPTQISIVPGDLNIANGQTWCIYGLGGSTTPFLVQKPAADGCYTISNVSGSGGDGPYNFTVPVDSSTFTFTGGGVAFQQMPLGPLGIYEDNASDFNAYKNSIAGVQYAIYANPTDAGYDGKYSSNHTYNFNGHGYMIASRYLGGHNSLLGEECDEPVVFCGQFLNIGNSSYGSEYQGGTFDWVLDNASWMWRLEACSGCSTYAFVSDMTSSGDKLLSRSSSAGVVRMNELSNHASAGNEAYYASIANYHSFGNQPDANALYTMPDSAIGDDTTQTSGLGPPGTRSTTALAMGLGTSCAVTPMYHTGGTFTMTGTIGTDTVNDGAFGALYLFASTPPGNGGSLSGTLALSGESGIQNDPTGTGRFPFTFTGVAPQGTMKPGNTYYIDIGLRSLNGGFASVQDITCTRAPQ